MRLAVPILAAAMTLGCQAAGQQPLDEVLRKGVVLPNKKAATPSQQPPQAPANPAQIAAPAGAARGATGTPAGFKMDLPSGWRARVEQNGAVVARSQDGLSVVIAPVPDTGNTPAAAWLKNRGPSALAPYVDKAVLTGVYPSRMGARVALASFDLGDGSAPGAANALCLMSGAVGTLYVIAGPKAVFPRARPALVRILQSFSFAGERVASQAGEGGPQAGFTRFQDPKEQAFTIDVPAGWKIEGGLVRKSAIDFRHFVWVTSPDGSTTIRIYDPSYGHFMIPDPVHASLGVREGMNYQVGLGLVEPVRRYIPGPDFAQQYAAKLVGDLLASNLQIKEVSHQQELSESKTTPYGTHMQTTGAFVDFTCTRNGQPCAGKVMAQTSLDSMSNRDILTGNMVTSGHWRVSGLASFLTTPERLAATDQASDHMIRSMRWDPKWEEMESKLAVDAAQANRDLTNYRAGIMDEVRRNRERSEERIHQNRIDEIRGVVRLRDPGTGEELEGVAGRNYYYRAPGGRTIGSDQEIRGPDFTELEQIR